MAVYCSFCSILFFAAETKELADSPEHATNSIKANAQLVIRIPTDAIIFSL